MSQKKAINHSEVRQFLLLIFILAVIYALLVTPIIWAVVVNYHHPSPITTARNSWRFLC